jgi:hypothetical protein
MFLTIKGEPWEVLECTRQEFLDHRWSYKPGDHVTFLAPTDGGKTTWTFELLERTATPKLPVINFAMKPRDVVMRRESERLGYPIVKAWPPYMYRFRHHVRQPSGWTLWAPHTFNIENDDEHLARVYDAALDWCYREGNCIVNLEELEAVQEMVGRKKLRGLYRRLRAMGGGLWAGSQEPKWNVSESYSQANHVFMGYDPTESNRKRFGEIGGVDPKLIEAINVQLPLFAWCYVRRRGRVVCVILP